MKLRWGKDYGRQSATCVNLDVHPEVAGITEGLTAVLTLVRLHPHVPHEVHVELSDCDECPGTHAAFILLLTHVTVTFPPDGDPVSVFVRAPPAVIAVCLSRVGVAGPRGGGGGARGAVRQFLFLVALLLLLLLRLRLLLRLLLLNVVLLWWAVAVRRLVVAVVAVDAAYMRLEIRERGALFATLT